MSNMKEITNILVPVVLFIILTPDLLFTLPSESSTTVEKTFTHATVFLVTYALLRTAFAQYY